MSKPSSFKKGMHPIQESFHDGHNLKALLNRVQASKHMLDCIKGLIPMPLRAYVLAGPVDEDVFCLLVPSSAAMAKLKQLEPLLLARLQAKAFSISKIRWKILSK